ncbi:hypothetical protein ACFVUH_10050 [Kitasatospora sp. NPDC058032]|uniref:hypothetical protein n=1 Tax=Kitasatospora sp. NPDC058032 TaxID=3346307 RepID=UPI0036DAB917
MHIAVQDPSTKTTYLLDAAGLAPFEAVPSQLDDGADIVFVLPSATLVEQVPVVPGSASADPSILISDPDGDRRWLLNRSDLERFACGEAQEGAIWFSLPDAEAGLYAAVPLFRRALVQNSS